MFINGLKFFTKTNDPTRTIIASWHSPHSLTWRWIVSWARFKAGERRAHWRIWWWSPNNTGVQWMLLIPWVGRIDGQTQRPIWYRTLYTRLQDERDTERYHASMAGFAERQRQAAGDLRGDAPLH